MTKTETLKKKKEEERKSSEKRGFPRGGVGGNKQTRVLTVGVHCSSSVHPLTVT